MHQVQVLELKQLQTTENLIIEPMFEYDKELEQDSEEEAEKAEVI